MDIFKVFTSRSYSSSLEVRDAAIAMLKTLVNSEDCLNKASFRLFNEKTLFHTQGECVGAELKSELRFGAQVVGYIVYHVGENISDELLNKLDNFQYTFALTWYHTWVAKVTEKLSKEVSFLGSRKELNCELAELIKCAYGASHVFIRERKLDAFECIGYAGRGDKELFLGKVLSKKRHNQVFNYIDEVVSAAARRSYSESTRISSSHDIFVFRHICDLVDDQKIESAVIKPMVFGGNAEGIVSLLFESKEKSVLIDERLLQLTANNVTISDKYFTTSAELANRQTQNISDVVDVLNFEIIQGLRHAACNHLETYRLEMIELEDLIKGNPKFEKQRISVDEAVEWVSLDLQQMQMLVSGKSHLNSPSYQGIFNIKELFEEAVNILDGKLKNKRGYTINVRYHGKDMYALCSGNLIRYAFINMIINSIRAIEDRSTGGKNDFISFKGEEVDDHFVIDVSDTGGGVPVGRGSIRTLNDIWESGKTSKSDGSGQGMVMVRDIFQTTHKGTIKVQSNDPNLKLRIELPKYPRGLGSEYSKMMKNKKPK